MKKVLNSIFLVTCLLLLTSCIVDEDPTPSYSELLVTRGDIAVANFTSDSIAIFGQDGTFKRVLYQLPLAADAIAGIAWNRTTNEILITVDGTPDRIDAVSVVTGIARSFYVNTTYFTGTPLGIVQLPDTGDIIASEGATIERFTSAGVREVHGAIWPSNAHATSNQLTALSTGNFLSCTTAAGARVFPDSITAVAAVYSVAGPAGATASYGCNELSDGQIVISWNGASDAVYLYSASLTGGTAIVNANPGLLTDPRGVAIGENDEIYVADATRNMIVQIDSAGNVTREFGNSILSGPRHLLVIPSFTP